MTGLKPAILAPEAALFRDGMARLGTAVNVVTTEWEGERYGFTASAVCSVSDAPPTLLVCLHRASASFAAFSKAQHFCVNTLRPGQEDLSVRFSGGVPRAERFAVGNWRRGETGVPVLDDSSVSFECALSSFVDVATHRILFGRVLTVRQHEEQASLLYCMRRYLPG